MDGGLYITRASVREHLMWPAGCFSKNKKTKKSGTWSVAREAGVDMINPSPNSVYRCSEVLSAASTSAGKNKGGHAARQASPQMRVVAVRKIFVDQQGRQTFGAPLGGKVEWWKTSAVSDKWKVAAALLSLLKMHPAPSCRSQTRI